MRSDPGMELLARATESLLAQFGHLPELPAPAPETLAAMRDAMEQAADRLGDNYPYFHPLYAGQMLKPPHPVARAAYALAMIINPNNHARDGGRASSQMEIEAVREIAAMFGWNGEFLGHLTSSGTIANLEALWVAGRCAETQGPRGQGAKGPKSQGRVLKGHDFSRADNPREDAGALAPGGRLSNAAGPKRILASAQAHYTHSRISAVLRLPFASVPTDGRGRMDLNALEDELRKGDVGTVVATLGTTAIGAVDPLPEILALARQYGARVHVDAAYGGYFKLIPEALDEPARLAFAAIHEADSIVVDPHKHGLQPYGCGCVLFRDPAVGRFYKHDSPYTYFTSKELHLGEISLECSRAGAAAVALWTTQRLLPLVPGGEFAQGLAAGRRAALELDRRIREDSGFAALAGGRPELDIVVWGVMQGSATRDLGNKGLGTRPDSEPARTGADPHMPDSELKHPAAEPCNNGTASAGPPGRSQSSCALAPAPFTPLADPALKGHDFSRADSAQEGGGLQPLRDVSPMPLGDEPCNNGTASAGPPERPQITGALALVQNPSLSSERAQAIFDACAKQDLHLALVQLPRSWFEPAPAGEQLTCLRSVLMKPEHEQWLDQIWQRIVDAARAPVDSPA